MIEAGIIGAKYEHLTIQEIINGTDKKGAWMAFLTSLDLSKDDEYQKKIRELEDMMKAYSTALQDNEKNRPEWKFPTQQQHRGWNDKDKKEKQNNRG